MGAFYSFTCSSCGYEAEVSGGPDCGFEARTETVVCKACLDLFDIVVGSSRDGEPVTAGELDDFGVEGLDSPEQAPIIEPGDCAPRRAPKGKRCPECRSRRLFLWSRADGCPKCGSAVTRGAGRTIMWD
jgi:ssDNA-binding Zn-finger/Zn-ribbon topoisomerase 1